MINRFDIEDVFGKFLYYIIVIILLAVGLAVLTLAGIGIYELIGFIFRACYPEYALYLY